MSCLSSDLTRHRDLSDLRDLSRVGARAGITTGVTPSLASWFLERKMGDGYRNIIDQSDWCLMFLFCQAWRGPRWPSG